MAAVQKQADTLPSAQVRDLERWLHEEVGPTFDAMLADPSRAISADGVARDLRADHATRLTRAREA